ncbi:hypothetical protein [Salipaludibacillus daqingensis]|uniref:hypothetical protein n=1 Tax=Salipaludibacillus daqingensis TaxID=3041001 RepID=UPI002476FB01|nr:hypothetical protein [Salipaludibacillus daqingensis]
MKKFPRHTFRRSMRNRFPKANIHWRMRKMIDIFYQLLLPLIIFQLIRTLLIPTTFDVILLTFFVVLYVLYWKS